MCPLKLINIVYVHLHHMLVIFEAIVPSPVCDFDVAFLHTLIFLLKKQFSPCFIQIQAINNEQDAFGKDITAYPERQQVINTLNPYLKLYETTVEFQEKHK